MSRTERPEQIMAPALRSIIKTIDLAIENGSLDPKDRDEVIKMFISGPTTVVDNKAGGGMMNMDEMIRPLGYAAGGPIPPEPEKTGMISGLLSLIKDRLVPEQREDGGAEYNKIFNFLWNQGFDSQQIDDIINRRVNQEDIVPSRKNLEEKFKG